MCEHCGCSDEGAGYTILNPADKSHSHHGSGMNHDDGHGHDHNNSHDHNHTHGHTHDHIHDLADRTHNPSRRVTVETDILHHNDLLAQRNRGFFEARNLLCLNLVSSPGSGKTTLLEHTIRLFSKHAVYVIEGDQQTSLDADRIQATGAPVVQVNTGNGCHLDADMIHKALQQLDPKQSSILLIENVGNLVCPALFDLGESFRVVIISVTEGEDKPLKYPNMFQTAQVCLINKTDLLPYIDFDLNKLKENARKVNPRLIFFELSARTGEGFQPWLDWMETVAGIR
jgi:hydrogenase nickel incorporation protein HypB